METQYWPKPTKNRAMRVCLLFFLFIGALVLVLCTHSTFNYSYKSLPTFERTLEFPLDCTTWNQTPTCPKDYPTTHNPNRSSNAMCPNYFRWIHKDLRHWKETGITREMVERARRFAHFRVVILNGKVYGEMYRHSYQTRDLFTLWGIVQLLRWYPGKLPDLELMFYTNDRPVVRSKDFQRPNSGPPPVFGYCSDGSNLDIVFPDWSFWGWAETNIKPWRSVLKDIKEGNKRTKWKDRVPLAYWRGNPDVFPIRTDLMKCNVTTKDDWNTLLYAQDWQKEYEEGYKHSNLEDQCTHRYKIYIEGWGWSVSEKYILACDSPTLLITPHFHDFFSRGMVPLQHYWPIRNNNKCKSLKFAVEWGNNHTAKSITTNTSFQDTFQSSKTSQTLPPMEINCSFTCPFANLVPHKPNISKPPQICPEYFKWIHEDLKPWKGTGITRKMVERAQNEAHIRIVVLNGRVYVQKYKWVFQSRDVFTVWGILQLMRLYPGKLPDLDLMFECGDKPVVHKGDYEGSKEAISPPPLFHYCGNETTFDIVFPDWSFWGWPELHIKPWEILRKELEEGNNRVKWMEREPYAYWKGNTKVASIRQDLVKCNATHDKHASNARIYELDWRLERQGGFQNADLASQCTQRYKIYVEGAAWSVSEKYILACDSVSLIITPHYYDFFTRSLVPTVHYWPINEKDKCRSIKFAVDWGNNHTQKAEEIGKAGSRFIQEELNMKNVYDYMYHLLIEYAKLLKYKPTVPKGAVEVCSETLVCSDKGFKKKSKLNSMVNGPSNTSPCTMPSPYDPSTLQAFLDRKESLTKQVEMWEASQDS